MMVNTKYRSKDSEIMDDLDMSGEMLIKTLDQIAGINKWLGGNGLTLDGIRKLLKNNFQTADNRAKIIRIVDVGCGNGDMLREVALFGKKNGFNFQLLGIDANQTTINYAKQLSVNFPEIRYLKEDVLSPEFKNHTYDIALCTLFLHHFEDKIAQQIIESLLNNAKLGVVINDLHRHRMAYYLFKALTLVIQNEMVKKDGLTSILRGFKRKDLEKIAHKIEHKSTITWRWAFRFQWIIYKQ